MDIGPDHPTPDDGAPAPLEWVKAHYPNATMIRIFDLDGMYACVYPLLFHWTLIYGRVGDIVGIEDKWCYQTQDGAERALFKWRYPEESEPEGWHRNPRTGRRRPDGDAGREYFDA